MNNLHEFIDNDERTALEEQITRTIVDRYLAVESVEDTARDANLSVANVALIPVDGSTVELKVTYRIASHGIVDYALVYYPATIDSAFSSTCESGDKIDCHKGIGLFSQPWYGGRVWMFTFDPDNPIRVEV